MALDDTYHPSARYVGRDSNQKVFAVACGNNTCTAPTATYPGRFVGFESGDKLYVVASECCQPPLIDPAEGENTDPGCFNGPATIASIYTHPFMVEKDHFPPRGVSRVIRVRMHAAIGCADKDCLASYLIYNEPASHTTACSQTVPSGHGWWSGCIGGLTIEAFINESEQLVVCYSGCGIAIPGSFILAEASAGCFFTDTAGAGGQISIGECCDCYDPDEVPPGGIITLTFRGYCGLYMQGRYVGHDPAASNKKVYAVGNCCMPDPCQQFTEDCCLALRHCPLSVELEVSGCCSDLSGVYNFVPVNHSSFPLTWQPETGSISACDLSWQFTLFCEDDPVTGEPSFRMAVQTPGQGCSCVASNHWEVLTTPCIPTQAEWDLNVTCTDTDPYNPPVCCNPTIHITVSF